jgi:calcium-dependent protein kinase
MSEIEILIKLDHPNIIKLYEIFENEKYIYLIMELCIGGELFNKIIEKTENGEIFNEREAANYFRQIILAISYCHNKKIAHRDLKPENILLLSNEKNSPIKLIDFGMSKFYKEKNEMSEYVGTAYYISPEVLEGKYDSKCDIWSAGVILYLLLSGTLPFDGENEEEIFEKIKMKKYDFCNSEWEFISDEAKDLIKGMLCDANFRFDINQVIKHSWIRKYSPIIKPWEKNNININSLKNYTQFNQLKKATINFIASRLNDKILEKYKSSFHKIDIKCNGMLDIEEMRKAIGNRGVVEDIFNSIDIEHSGFIEFTKFVAANIDKNIYLNERRLKDAFKIFDLNQNGKINKKDVQDFLKINDNDKEISCLFEKYGIGEEMNFEQFEKMMNEELVNED